MDFRNGLDEQKESYVVAVYRGYFRSLSKSPVFVKPDPKEKKRGRKRKYPNEINLLPVKVSHLGKCVAEGDWEYLEIRRDCMDTAGVEVVSKRVFPAQGYRKGTTHNESRLFDSLEET